MKHRSIIIPNKTPNEAALKKQNLHSNQAKKSPIYLN